MFKPRILNWNLGGAKFLKLQPPERGEFKDRLNASLKSIVADQEPDIIALQEIVLYGDSNDPSQLIDPPDGYYYHPEVSIDTKNQANPIKWQPFRDSGGWAAEDYLAQGNGILWRSSLAHGPLWESSASVGPDLNAEVVRMDTGIFTGTRDTEPRVVLVGRFLYEVDGNELDLLVVNLHLSTLKGEREGLPEIDEAGTRTRMNQIEVVLHGIVSRYNQWRSLQSWARKQRPAVWIISGDLNSTPTSPEVERVRHLNFLDLCPNKGKGNKGKGLGGAPSLTVDYIFAGPKFVALNPYIAELEIQENPTPLTHVKVSDHFPIFATIPVDKWDG